MKNRNPFLLYKKLEIIEEIPNENLFNLNDIQLMPILDFVKKHKISQYDFAKRNEILKKEYRVCNLQTFKKINELFPTLGRLWRCNVLFLGTKFKIPQTESFYLEYYPYLHYHKSHGSHHTTPGLYSDTPDNHRLVYWINGNQYQYHIAVY